MDYSKLFYHRVGVEVVINKENMAIIISGGAKEKAVAAIHMTRKKAQRSSDQLVVKKLDGDQVLQENSDDEVVTKLSSWLKIPKHELEEYSKKTSSRILSAKATRKKVWWLKQARDYSFLSSSDQHDAQYVTTNNNNNNKAKSRCSSVLEKGMMKKGNYSRRKKLVVPMLNREKALRSVRRKRKMDHERQAGEIEAVKGSSDSTWGRKKARTTINTKIN